MRKTNKGFFLFINVCAFLFISSSCVLGNVELAPLNPAYVRYIEKIEKQENNQRSSTLYSDLYSDNTAETDESGYVPSPLSWEHLKDKVWNLNLKETYRTSSTLPKYYRIDMPAVRNQNSFGNCWVYSAMGATESSLIQKGITTTDIELSEWYLTYYAYNNWYDDMAPFYSGYAYYLAGGNDWKAVALLSRGTGSVLASYSPNISYSSQAYTPNISSRDYKLLNAYYLGEAGDFEVLLDSSRIDMIKRAIINYSGVSVGLYSVPLSKGDSTAYNASTYGYYSGKTLDEVSTDHAVVLVGWDDDYPAYNFGTNQPTSDGAWIVRNSWGSNWGENGYFYISYEEGTLCDGVVYETVAAPENEKIYQHDPLGCNNWCAPSSNSTTQYFANVFEADTDDYINSVAFYVPDTDITYEISIYTECDDSSPIGTLAEGSVTTVDDLVPGYNTIDLEEKVFVEEGTKFSVVVKATLGEEAFKYAVPIELKGSSSYRYATANEGEGWVSIDGINFTDILIALGSSYQTSICLKAFGEAGNAVKSVTTISTYTTDDSGGGCNAWNGYTIVFALVPLTFDRLRKKRKK